MAIHIRVGNVSSPSHAFNFPGPEYFQLALQYFRTKWDKVIFLVFTDNPGWCKNQSLLATKDVHIVERDPEPNHWPSPQEYVNASLVNASTDDLTMMSACDGVITSVGSFGWWAGYFSFQNGGEVLYFKNIFNTSYFVRRGKKLPKKRIILLPIGLELQLQHWIARE